MPDLNCQELQRYLGSLLHAPVQILNLTELGRPGKDLKHYGYGVPIRIDFKIDGQPQTAVLHTMSPGPFGHEHMADRAGELIWSHHAFNQLPRHVQSLDICGFQKDGKLISAGKVEEFGILTGYLEGQTYSHDLERIRDCGGLTELDISRADALCDYLVQIHKEPQAAPGLYVRRIRELVGHGECIMGITDSYADHPEIPSGLLERIEHLAVAWRWKLKKLTYRLRTVHGDFHPWNILFRAGAEFSVLDRSRGEVGEPADDLTSITLNYVFFSLQRSGRLEGGFERLFRRFWERYLERTGDQEILRVAAPFIAFRGLVMASPAWYPNLPESVRHKLFSLIVTVLENDTFDPAQVNRYCGA